MSRTNAEQEQNLLDSVYCANRLISGAWSESKELLNYCFFVRFTWFITFIEL